MPILSEDPVAPFSEPWIFRRVEAVEGPVAFEVTFEPRFDYARARTIIESMDDVLLARGSGEHVSLNTASPLDIVDKTASGIHELDAGETAWYTLQYGQHKRPESIDPERLLERTRRYWRNWVHDCPESDCPFGGEYHDAVTRSELVLKLLILTDTSTWKYLVN
jgi:GH15 family glucan-1,4-alpha-glucosidase